MFKSTLIKFASREKYLKKSAQFRKSKRRHHNYRLAASCFKCHPYFPKKHNEHQKKTNGKKAKEKFACNVACRCWCQSERSRSERGSRAGCETICATRACKRAQPTNKRTNIACLARERISPGSQSFVQRHCARSLKENVADSQWLQQPRQKNIFQKIAKAFASQLSECTYVFRIRWGSGKWLVNKVATPVISVWYLAQISLCKGDTKLTQKVAEAPPGKAL